MTLTRKIILAISVIGTVFFVIIFSNKINDLLNISSNDSSFIVSISTQILNYLVPAILVLLVFHQPKNIFAELGLDKGFFDGLKYSFLFTLPMLVGYFFLGKYNVEQPLIENLVRAFKDGFREEIFYRAFLFGQLFRNVKLGFIPAVLVNAAIFGVMHIYQAHSLSDAIGIFAITFAGAVWFAWLYIEWKQNLWLPILMHFFMNFYWQIFSTEQTALGGFMLNFPRILTIAISIYCTIKIVKKSGKLTINKSNLWFQ